MNPSDFDRKRLQISKEDLAAWRGGRSDRKLLKRQRGNQDKFVKGPLPLPWLSKATPLSGKALAVGLAIWFLRGCHKTDRVKLTRQTLDQFGVKRKAGYSGLKKLEEAGLVAVDRGVGRSPVVTILNP